MNRTPHIVGGGLGTFKKEAAAKHAREKQAAREKQNKEALAKLAKSVKK